MAAAVWRLTFILVNLLLFTLPSSWNFSFLFFFHFAATFLYYSPLLCYTFASCVINLPLYIFLLLLLLLWNFVRHHRKSFSLIKYCLYVMASFSSLFFLFCLHFICCLFVVRYWKEMIPKTNWLGSFDGCNQ